jgi:hypothetical protein
MKKCISFNKPYPLYYINFVTKKKIRICQDCGFLETCHGPDQNSGWRHIILHPDYKNVN